MPITPFVRSGRKGFTLIELLVVIGIIVLLISILLPAISKVRQAAYAADTQSEISTISGACHQYYLDFTAFPGPFTNNDIEGQSTPALTDVNSGASYSNAVTMSQNLVLGLLGGLTKYNSSNVYQVNTYYIDELALGKGPLSLNQLNPVRKSPYISNSQGLLSQTPFADAAGKTAGDNTGIPVFIDRFIGSQMPILYLRARTNGAGIVSSGGNINDMSGATLALKLQYDLNQIRPYVTANPVIGTPSYTITNTNGTFGPGQHGLTDVAPNATGFAGVAADFPKNAGSYFADQNVLSGVQGTTRQITGRPRQVDQFILISAGKDGTYGSPDDLTNFGGVSN